MKPWPEGAIGLISGRLDDPYCHPTPGHVLRQCYNCEQTVRVGLPNQQIEIDHPGSTVVVCVQCWRAYYDTGMPMVMFRQPPEGTNKEAQDAQQRNTGGS